MGQGWSECSGSGEEGPWEGPHPGCRQGGTVFGGNGSTALGCHENLPGNLKKSRTSRLHLRRIKAEPWEQGQESVIASHPGEAVAWAGTR